MATTDDTLRALLDGHLDRLRVGFRHRWRCDTRYLRNAIHHVRALRKALGIRPRVTVTHEVGDLWERPDYGHQARTTEVTPRAITIRPVHPHTPMVRATGTPAQFTRAGWRRVR